eukprot:5612763-Ditylum_brightwellii.AAC.1
MAHLAAATFLKHYSRCIKTPSECLAPDYDIQSQTEAIYEEMDWEWETAWVKGHQDKAIR